jgi:Fe-S-cluster-containing dehydrogenase component
MTSTHEGQPYPAAEGHDDVMLDRRDFLRLAGASLALAGLDGCTRLPAEHILPYVDSRPELTPGIAQYYATAMCIDGLATGLIVESHVGRPTKIEGNPDHPASLGATGPLEQASVLQLYDPDRAKTARIGASPATWDVVAASLGPRALRQRLGPGGRGLHFLIEPTSSPLDEDLLARVVETYPESRVHMYAPLVPDRASSTLVQHYDFSAADVILAVDSDFLASGSFHLRYARQFADGRRLARPADPMNRLYVVESSFTPTGSAADHRFAIRPRELVPLLRALLASIAGTASAPNAPGWLQPVARDLTSHSGRSVVVLGPSHSAEAHALVGAINAALGAYDHTTWFSASPLIGGRVQLQPFTDLVSDLDARAVDTLVIVGGNPAYTTPAALGFAGLVANVANSGYVGLYENETARAARWFVPMSHYLERWGDARAHDGSLSIVQPLIAPLYRSIAPCELYAAVAGVAASNTQNYDLLRASWAARTGGDAEAAWNEALQRGVVRDTQFARVAGPSAAPIAAAPLTPSAGDGIDVVYLPDAKVHDGEFSNNGWLQELPGPLTQLTWGNAALLSPATARRTGVSTGDPVTLTADRRHLTIPAMIVPGHADDCVSLTFGYGRAGAESAARGVGANAFQLWPSIGTRFERGVSIVRDGSGPALAVAQTHETMDVSRPVRTATLDEYRASPASVGQRPGRVLSLYPEPAPPVGLHGPNQWAMTIDLGTCIGCGACVVACQAENNIPVIGADEVRRGRQMQWIHVDRYFAEHEADVDALLQPMLCQHCEKAPCEYVCPVEATTHSPDGLNEMVYNRCVGTRFCSNNCPYKVRHFNWFDYNARLSETELMVKNPNVTVRERGVMEKCTFCVQRIREAEIAAGRDGRTLHGSEVRTACQQSCPTNAIVFGSLTDADSDMVRRREQPRAYSVLHELGTEPRVRYLARVRNTNGDLPGNR